MQNLLKSWENMYTITYKVDSYFPFQWEVYLVCYLTDPSHLWNEKATRLASGEIFLVSSHSPDSSNIFITKYIQIIIQNTSSIKELRQCVHNNLQSWFIFTISVGSVTVIWLYDRCMFPLKWESQNICKWSDILVS